MCGRVQLEYKAISLIKSFGKNSGGWLALRLWKENCFFDGIVQLWVWHFMIGWECWEWRKNRHAARLGKILVNYMRGIMNLKSFVEWLMSCYKMVADFRKTKRFHITKWPLKRKKKTWKFRYKSFSHQLLPCSMFMKI